MKTLFKSRVNTRLLKFLLNQHKALIFVYTVLFFALFPLTVITQILRPAFSSIMSQPNPELFPELLVYLSIPVFLISPFILFHYVFSKRAISTFNAMPIKRRDMFITLTFVSFISVAIPFVINYILGYSIAYLGSNVVYTLDHLLNLGRSLVLLSALMAIAILVITNTGALSEGIIYTGIALSIPFVAIFAFNFFAERFIYGYTDVSDKFLYYLSPFVSLFRIFSDPRFLADAFQKDLVTSYWFIGTLLLLVISILIFDKRKSERTEMPFTNNLFFPLVASCFTVFLLVSLISIFAPYEGTLFEPASFIMPIVISFIVFIILNIIKDRSTKGIVSAMKNFAIIMVVSLAITSTAALTGGFGYVTRLPKLSNIDRVVIDNSYYSMMPQPNGGSNNYVIEDPAGIKLLLDFHQELLDEYKKNPNRYDGNTYKERTIPFQFSYELTNGATIERNYYLPENKMQDIVENLNGYMQTRAVIANLKDSEFIKDFQITSPFLDTVYDFDGSLNELLQTYYDEVDFMSLSEFQSGGGKLIYNILVTTTNHYEASVLSIDARFIKTIAYIEGHLNGSSQYRVDEVFYEEVLVNEASFGCQFNPYNGIITSDTYFYSCLKDEFKSQEIDISQYDAYPYSRGERTFQVVQVGLYVDNYPVSLMIPVLKK